MEEFSADERIALMLIPSERPDVVSEIEKHCKDLYEVERQILAFSWLIYTYNWDYRNPDEHIALQKKFYKEVDGTRYPDWINIKGFLIELENVWETGWAPPE